MAHFQGGSTTNFGTGVTGQTNAFFIPEIFSQKVLVAFRKSSVAEALCNTDYIGELKSFGDTVNIIAEPQISVYDYTRGSTITNTALTDEELVLVVDQAKAFQFTIDDIETRFSNINWQSLAADNAAYKLKDAMDVNVLAAMKAGALAANNYGSTTDVIDVGFGSGEVDPLDVLARQARLLDEQNVPEENRWFVAEPKFYEELAKTSSKLLSVDYNQGDGGLKNGLIASGQLRGFKMYKSQNLPSYTATGTSAAFGTPKVVMAGHMSSTACASAMNNVETVRSTTTFADIVRGLLVWGRKVLRPEAISVGYIAMD